MNISKERLAKAHKSLTVWIGTIFTFTTAFFGMHPEYLMDIGAVVMPTKPELIRDLLVVAMSGTGLTGIVYGKTRNAPPLEER